jgi:hypothetical protein
VAMRQWIEIIYVMKYKLRMFGIKIL